MRDAVSMPPMPGIDWSTTMTHGSSSATCAIASVPLAASPSTNRPALATSMVSRMSRRMSASSSMMSAPHSMAGP